MTRYKFFMFTGLLILIFLMSGIGLQAHPYEAGTHHQDSGICVYVDGEQVAFDQPPVNINGRVLVPLRAVAEKMGCDVGWDDATLSACVNSHGVTHGEHARHSGHAGVFVNNSAIHFPDQQPVIMGERVLIPIRFVAEELGYCVRWDESVQAVYIEKEDGGGF